MSGALIFLQWMPSPSPNGAPVVTPLVGTWPVAQTVRLIVGAWRTASESDLDHGGFDRSDWPVWQDIALDIDDRLAVSFNNPDPTVRWDHFSLYGQVGSGPPDFTLPFFKVKELVTQEATGTFTLDEPEDLGTLIIGESATTVIMDPVYHLQPAPVTKKVSRRADGRLGEKSLLRNRFLDGLGIVFTGMSVSDTNMKILGKWIGDATPILLLDPDDSGILDPAIHSYTGRLVDTDYLGSPEKNPNDFFRLEMDIEGTSGASVTAPTPAAIMGGGGIFGGGWGVTEALVEGLDESDIGSGGIILGGGP